MKKLTIAKFLKQSYKKLISSNIKHFLIMYYVSKVSFLAFI